MTVGWLTLDVGEQALIYDSQGVARVEEGPQRLFLWRALVKHLQSYTANQSEYLVIHHKDGTIEHKTGPCVFYHNPLVHRSITVKEGIPLDANEILVVYQRNVKSNEVVRRLHHGPTLFIPSANEWLHNFSWHGTDPGNKTHMIPNGNTFTKLRVIPDQFYYNVDEVRTADDALIRIKLMMFYELQSIEQMLNTTQDPMGDFVNCLCADVIAYTSKLTYMEFIERSGELNEMSNYPQLVKKSQSIGYCINKVVFRGYYASPTLQKMHDKAIETRTKLMISYEQEEQEQALTDTRLKSEMDRITLEQSMELEKMRHKRKIENSEQDHKMTLKVKNQEQIVSKLRDDKKAVLQRENARQEDKLAHYNQLKGLQVDVEQYLQSLNKQPAKVIRVVAAPGAANLHLHQN